MTETGLDAGLQSELQKEVREVAGMLRQASHPSSQ
eukprot:COSAG05_NODE_116_length_17986_cov_348.987534_17_plen_35_part_00